MNDGADAPHKPRSANPKRLQLPKRNRDETGASIKRALCPNPAANISFTNKTG